MRVKTNWCGANGRQDFFNVINDGSTSVLLSDIEIKFWADDTTGQTLVPHVYTGGCVTNVNGNPSCSHSVSGVTAATTSFSPSCGSDATHQANWEVTVSTTDSTSLPPGAVWSNIQTALNLANFGNFSPGSTSWFSPCVAGSNFASDVHFAVYYRGNLVLSSGVDAPSCRAPHGSQQLSGYVVPPLSNAPIVGPVPASTPITLGFGLPGQNPTGLQAFAHEVSDPSNPKYHQYLSPSAFAATYGATPNDYQGVETFLQAQGLSIAATYSDNLYLLVSGSASTFEKVLYANLVYRQRPDGTTFVSIDRDPSLDLTIPLLHITGLETLVPLQPAGGGSGGPPPGSSFQCFASDPCSGLFTSSDLRNAYVCDANLNGKGQNVGIAALGAYRTIDFQTYESAMNSSVPVHNVGTPTLGPPYSEETNGDIQAVIAVTTASEVLCWGFNGDGELGDGTKMDRPLPVSVTDSSMQTLFGLTAVSAGAHHTCALNTAGDVFCWGANFSGQIGNDSVTFQSNVALPVTGLPEPAIAISAGDSHTCAVTSSGAVWCWGSNGFGQLGNPQPAATPATPVQVLGVDTKPLLGFSSVAAGTTSTCGVLSSGVVACWGDISFGGPVPAFLGNGPPTDSSSEAFVFSGVNTVVSVSEAGTTSCFAASGSVQCWGLGDAGELGNGMTADSQTPAAAVTGITTATAVSVGSVDFACALTGSGAVLCWGLDSQGQLGNASFTGAFSDVPLEVTGF